MTAKRQNEAVNIRLVFFGDSICVGQGISIHKGWVPRIASSVEQLAASHGKPLTVVNASTNGNTTRLALERMPYDVQSHGVDIMLVQFGLNDCNHWVSDNGLPRVSPKGFAANLEEIIERGRRFGAKKILINTNHPTTRDSDIMPGSGATYEAHNRRYNAIIREVAAHAGGDVLLNDIERVFLDHTGGVKERLAELLLSDALHLSLKGHDLYYEVMRPRVTAAVEHALRAT